MREPVAPVSPVREGCNAALSASTVMPVCRQTPWGSVFLRPVPQPVDAAAAGDTAEEAVKEGGEEREQKQSMALPPSVASAEACAVASLEKQDESKAVASTAVVLPEEFSQCKDTALLVTQLANALKGLEADLDHLRRENRTLRQTMALQAGGAFPQPLAACGSQYSTLSSTGELLRCVSKEDAAGEKNEEEVAAIGKFPLGSKSMDGVSTPSRPNLSRQRYSMQGGSTPTPPPPGTGSEAVFTLSPQPLIETETIRPATSSTSLQADQFVKPPMDTAATLAPSGSATPSMCSNSGPNGCVTSASSLWMIEQSVWLGRDPPDPQVGVTVIDRSTIVSVAAAVDGLNRGNVKCADDVCVVFSAANRGYYALYRRGHKEKAQALSPGKRSERVPDSPEVTRPSPFPSTTPSSVSCDPMPASVFPQLLMGGAAPTPATPEPSPCDQVLDQRPEGEVHEGLEPSSPSTDVKEVGIDPVREPSSIPEATGSAVLAPIANGCSSRARSVGCGTSSLQMQSIVPPGSESASLAAGSAAQAEMLLQQAMQSGARPVEAGADAVIVAFAEEGDLSKAEEWLWRTLEGGFGRLPSEATFAAVVFCACKDQQTSKAEEIMLQMMRMRMRPSKELFDAIIHRFSEEREVWKVEEWLLHAGQSGWTPAQPAFESVVLLYAERDVVKAEEWLSRAQQTEYTLPDQCFDTVIHALASAGDAQKVSDWLVRMVSDGRSPSDATLREVVMLLIEVGDVRHAETWLAQLVGRQLPVQDLSHLLYSAAMRAGDLDCAERQLVALNDADPERTEYLIVAHAQLGDATRAKNVFDHFVSLGGVPTPQMHAALLSACAFAGDVTGTESVARGLASSTGLSQSQVSLLRQTLGDERTDIVLCESAPGAALTPEKRGSKPAAAPRSAAGARVPSATASRARASEARSSPAASPKLAASKAAPKAVQRRPPPGAVNPRTRAVK